MKFQSTRPVRDATSPWNILPPPIEFQSTRPVRDATRPGLSNTLEFDVSIHASRAGRDSSKGSLSLFSEMFQSTRPVRDATPASAPSCCTSSTFQSTRPVRDATWNRTATSRCTGGFNPRVPCGTRPSKTLRMRLRVEFQSTRPVRDATPTMPPLLAASSRRLMRRSADSFACTSAPLFLGCG